MKRAGGESSPYARDLLWRSRGAPILAAYAVHEPTSAAATETFVPGVAGETAAE